MAKQGSRLGKGLSSLVRKPAEKKASASVAPAVAEAKAPVAEVASVGGVVSPAKAIPIEQVQVNRQQPREYFAEQPLMELTESIKMHGIMQPLVVRKSAKDGQYELIAGERRLRAARLAGLSEVPVTLRECDDRESLELALIENLQREDLNPLERARAYRKYLDETGSTTEELAQRVGQSRPNISNHLRLLNLNHEVQDMVAAGELQMGHAKALLGVSEAEQQLATARQVVRRQLTARQVEALVGQIAQPKDSPSLAAPQRHMQALEDALERSLGVRVNIVPGRKKNAGRIVLHYGDLTEFDRIAEKLGLTQLSD